MFYDDIKKEQTARDHGIAYDKKFKFILSHYHMIKKTDFAPHLRGLEKCPCKAEKLPLPNRK